MNLTQLEITKWLLAQISEMSGQKESLIPTDQAFVQLGLTSMDAVQLVGRLKKDLQIEISPTLLFDYPTVDELAEYLSKTPDSSLTKSELKSSETALLEEIGISGMACRFPGAPDLNSFQSLLEDGKSGINLQNRFHLSQGVPSEAGYIENLDQFDPSLFGISSAEAAAMDPQQRILLQVVVQAIDDAGLKLEDLKNTNTGVFVGISSSDYSILMAKEGAQSSLFDGTGNAHSIAANRISYLLGLRGPSFSVDTACSSSLVAVHLARKSILNGECDRAIVGGVNLMLIPDITENFFKANMLSPDARCKTFSEGANGYVRGEGAGALILERASIIEKSHRKSRVLLKGSAINQDGRTNGLTAPSSLAQEMVIKDALNSAHLEAKDIGYVEAHGTGTSLGDPIEYDSLNRTYGANPKLYIGSVKTNIGHLEAAAGMSGLIKAALSVQSKKIFPHLNYTEINKNIAQVNPKIEIPLRKMDWDNELPLRAGISSFGFGGTNAHVILEANENAINLSEKTFNIEPEPNFYLLPFSSSSVESLLADLEDLTKLIDTNQVKSIGDLSLSLINNRSQFKFRCSLVAKDLNDLKNQITDLLEKPRLQKQKIFSLKKVIPRKVLGLFTGQGSQSPKMGMDLYQFNSTYRDSFNQVAEIYRELSGIDIHRALYIDDDKAAIYQTDLGQILILATEYALFQLWKGLGVQLEFAVGHSLGEIIALACNGSLSLNSAVELIHYRGQVMQKSAPGQMLTLFTDKVSTEKIIKEQGLHLDIAAINGPELTLASGLEEEVAKLNNYCEKEGIRSKVLPVKQGFHSYLMEPVLSEFKSHLKGIEYSKGQFKVMSCKDLKFHQQNQLSPEFWAGHLRNATNFNGAIERLPESEFDLILEIGPHPTLISMYKEIRPDSKVTQVSSLNRKKPDMQAFLENLGLMWCTGYPVQLGQLRKAKYHLQRLAPRHFATQSFWFKKAKASDHPQFRNSTPAPLDPRAVPSAEIKIEAKKPQTPVPQKRNDMAHTVDNVLKEIKEIVAEQLEVDVEEIDTSAPLMEMGADSLVLLNSLEIIKDEYGVSVSVSDVLGDLGNLDKIADHVAKNTTQTSSPQTQSAIDDQSADTHTSAEQVSNPQSNLSQVQQAMFQAQTQVNLSQNLLSGGEVSNDLIQLLNNQMIVIQNQISLLAGQSYQSPQANQAVSVKSQTPTATKTLQSNSTESNEASGKGVLGNFSKSSFNQVDQLDEEKSKYIDQLISEFTAKTKTSKDLAETYRIPLADNRVPAGFRPRIKEMIYPIAWKKAKGSKFWDVDGNEYTDYTMGFGVNLFGHSPDFINDKVAEQLSQGMAVGPQSHLAGTVAKKICELTNHERVAFLNSGTEAIMTAVRLARAATGRQKVVLFEGSYHGHYDGVLGRANRKGNTVPVAPGISEALVSDLIILEYNSPEALDYIRNNANQLAAVLCESVQSRFPEVRPQEFLKEVRNITSQSGTALIMDEVITGFRAAPGGAQELFGVQADLACYGKVLGGGLPIGAIAGAQKYLDFIDGGEWHFGDQSMPVNEMTFFAGTFCKHPLAMAASLAVLNKLQTEGKKILDDLNERTQRLAEELNEFFQARKTDIEIVYFSSLFRFKFKGNKDWLFSKLNFLGHYIWEGRNMFLSTAHSEDEIKQFVNDIKATTDELIKIGYIPGEIAEGTEINTQSSSLLPKPSFEKMSLDLIEPQTRFYDLVGNESTATVANICVAVDLMGQVDKKLLEASIQKSIVRHDILWANFADAKAHFGERVSGFELKTTDLTQVTAKESALKEILSDLASTPMGPEQFPISIELIELDQEHSVLALSANHLSLDGLSLAILTDEIAKIYTAGGDLKKAKLKEALRFSDYMKDYPTRIAKLTDSIKYWDDKVKTLYPGTLDHSKSYKGQRVYTQIEEPEFKLIKRFGFKNSSSLLMTLIACSSKVLAKMKGFESLSVGVPVAGHTSITQPMLGNCVNLVPINVEVNATTEIKSMIPDLKKEVLESFKHADIPFIRYEKSLGKPLFDVHINVEPISDLPKFGTVKTQWRSFPVQSVECPIIINALKIDKGFRIEMDYQEDTFNTDEAKSFMDQLVAELNHLVETEKPAQKL